MNANKLINKLKLVRCLAGDGQVLNEAEAMIRQQQAEITKLKLEWQVWSDMNFALKERVSFLESQVYGGTTK